MHWLDPLFWTDLVEDHMEEISDVRELMRRTRKGAVSRVRIAAPQPSTGVLLDCFVPGHPKPQVRPRMTRAGHAYSPKSGWYDLLVMAFGAAEIAGRPLGVPLRIDADFYLPRPQTLMRKADPDGAIWAPVRPDRDNLDKAMLDAMTASGLVTDDNLAVDGSPRKLYHAKDGEPGVRIIIRLAGEPKPLEATA